VKDEPLVSEQAARLRILLVEDDAAFVDYLRTSLTTTAPTLQLTVARRLSSALSTITSDRFDAVLLDLNLPDSEGLETLREITSVAAHVPIVVLTGIDDADQAHEAVRLGAEDWLTKVSGDPEVVVRALRYAIERKRLTSRLVRLQKLEAVGRLAGSVAHEFNNVLTAIVCNVALAQSVADDHVKGQALREVQHAASRGSLLTRQLLGVARPATTSAPVADVSHAVNAVQSLLQAVLPPDVELRWEAMERLRVTLVPEQLEQVLLNLLLNARDAVGRRGTIVVSANRTGERANAQSQDGRRVQIAVSDSGAGIPSEVMTRIFEPFFTTKGQAGSGLGLAISKELIEQAGGAIRVENTPGAGATFTIELPEAPTSTGN
jgi:two-component system cell cycle sensor histidine kinase/response regulator CckA